MDSEDIFGSAVPFAEPLWYSRNSSPYYKASHRTLRAYVREYVETDLKPVAEECEKQGFIPPEVCTSRKSCHLSY